MKNKLFVPAMLLVLVAGLYSCDDFIEKDLSKKSVVILSPSNNYTATSYTQLFWWDEVKGAEEYNLQIVKPSFANTQLLVVDTMVHSNQFSFTLQPGVYQWRLRAMNNSSHTDYVTYNLTVDSSLDIHNDPVPLFSPVDAYHTNVLSQTFQWTVLPTATNYLFQVLDVSGAPIFTQTTAAHVYSYTFPAGGSYSWRVQGQNSFTSSQWGTRGIVIDTAAPPVPVITYVPLDDTTSANPIPLTWSSSESGLMYQLVVSTDSTFSGVSLDTTTSSLSYNFRNPILGTFYYWRIRSIDAATNTSLYCYRRRFKRL